MTIVLVNRNVDGRVCPAGWGVVVLYVRKGESEINAHILSQLYGPVELDTTDEFYIGAEKGRRVHFGCRYLLLTIDWSMLSSNSLLYSMIEINIDGNQIYDCVSIPFSLIGLFYSYLLIRLLLIFTGRLYHYAC